MNQETITAEAPASTPQFRMKDVSTLTARLAQIMAEEVDLLTGMKVAQIDALQKEKLFLINALEAQKKLVARLPQLKETITEQEREDFDGLVNVFNDILQENHRKLQLAKEANQYVVKAITKVVKEQAASRYYDSGGNKHAAKSEVLSVTLNKHI